MQFDFLKILVFLAFAFLYTGYSYAMSCAWKPPVYYAEYLDGKFLQAFKVHQKSRGGCFSGPEVTSATTNAVKEYFSAASKHFKVDLNSGTYVFTNACMREMEESCLAKSKLEAATGPSGNFMSLKDQWQAKQADAEFDDVKFNIGWPLCSILIILLPFIFRLFSKKKGPFTKYIKWALVFQCLFLFILFGAFLPYIWDLVLRRLILRICIISVFLTITGQIIYVVAMGAQKLSRKISNSKDVT